MVTILAIDTSASACAAALWRDGEIVAVERAAMTRGHAEALMPMIERVMQGCAYAALDAVAVTAGPGAFTGLRIGLAAARGIALAARIPAIGVSAFAAIAHAVPDSDLGDRSLAVAIDTKRGDLYLQCFDERRTPLGPGRVAGAAELVSLLPPGPILLAGDGAGMAAQALTAERRDVTLADVPATPDPAAIAALAAEQLAAARRTGAALPPPEPLYLRAPEATPLELQGKPRRKAQ